MEPTIRYCLLSHFTFSNVQRVDLKLIKQEGDGEWEICSVSLISLYFSLESQMHLKF